MRFRLLAFATALLLTAPAAHAQSPPEHAWDAERPLELIRRAQLRRAGTLEDTALINYAAQARAFVYFYLDREDTAERNLIRTDQLALEVFWQSPDRVKQRIIGWRDRLSLPSRIHYHVDHLSVVQENFGDEIRIGDGDEVRDVPHPAAPGSELIYQFQLVDSLTLRLPGVDEPVQVYQLRVRPRDGSRPAIVGSVFIDRRAGDIVRMDFTFTAAAYVDEYLDYINISLDNGLWRGRFWLPNEQRVELRRRLPMLDIPAGTIIRANMRVGSYEFNQPLPPLTFTGPEVVAVPRAQREAFDFEEEIFSELRELGLTPEMELGEIRRAARELARREALRRVSGLRLSAGGVSDVLRFNRAEGLVLGAGVAVRPHDQLHLRGRAGWAFGPGLPQASAAALARLPGARVEASLHLNAPGDVGLAPAASGLGNTLSSAFAGSDHTEPYRLHGGRFGVARPLGGGWEARLDTRAEVHEAARAEVESGLFGGAFRPVRPIDEGTLIAGRMQVARGLAPHLARVWGADLSLGGGTLHATGECTRAGACPGNPSFLKTRAGATWLHRRESRQAELRLDGSGGVALGTVPAQELDLLGGRGTVPGYDFRSFGGDRFALLRASASLDVDPTWLRLRLSAAAGWSEVTDASEAAALRWQLPTTSTLRSSVGVGAGLLHDILRVELHRGFGSAGRWELIVDSHPGFWDFL